MIDPNKNKFFTGKRPRSPEEAPSELGTERKNTSEKKFKGADVRPPLHALLTSFGIQDDSITAACPKTHELALCNILKRLHQKYSHLLNPFTVMLLSKNIADENKIQVLLNHIEPLDRELKVGLFCSLLSLSPEDIKRFTEVVQNQAVYRDVENAILRFYPETLHVSGFLAILSYCQQKKIVDTPRIIHFLTNLSEQEYLKNYNLMFAMKNAGVLDKNTFVALEFFSKKFAKLDRHFAPVIFKALHELLLSKQINKFFILFLCEQLPNYYYFVKEQGVDIYAQVYNMLTSEYFAKTIKLLEPFYTSWRCKIHAQNHNTALLNFIDFFSILTENTLGDENNYKNIVKAFIASHTQDPDAIVDNFNIFKQLLMLFSKQLNQYLVNVFIDWLSNNKLVAVSKKIKESNSEELNQHYSIVLEQVYQEFKQRLSAMLDDTDLLDFFDEFWGQCQKRPSLIPIWWRDLITKRLSILKSTMDTYLAMPNETESAPTEQETKACAESSSLIMRRDEVLDIALNPEKFAKVIEENPFDDRVIKILRIFLPLNKKFISNIRQSKKPPFDSQAMVIFDVLLSETINHLLLSSGPLPKSTATMHLEMLLEIFEQLPSPCYQIINNDLCLLLSVSETDKVKVNSRMQASLANHIKKTQQTTSQNQASSLEKNWTEYLVNPFEHPDRRSYLLKSGLLLEPKYFDLKEDSDIDTEEDDIYSDEELVEEKKNPNKDCDKNKKEKQSEVDGLTETNGENHIFAQENEPLQEIALSRLFLSMENTSYCHKVNNTITTRESSATYSFNLSRLIRKANLNQLTLSERCFQDLEKYCYDLEKTRQEHFISDELTKGSQRHFLIGLLPIQQMVIANYASTGFKMYQAIVSDKDIGDSRSLLPYTIRSCLLAATLNLLPSYYSTVLEKNRQMIKQHYTQRIAEELQFLSFENLQKSKTLEDFYEKLSKKLFPTDYFFSGESIIAENGYLSHATLQKKLEHLSDCEETTWAIYQVLDTRLREETASDAPKPDAGATRHILDKMKLELVVLKHLLPEKRLRKLVVRSSNDNAARVQFYELLIKAIIPSTERQALLNHDMDQITTTKCWKKQESDNQLLPLIWDYAALQQLENGRELSMIDKLRLVFTLKVAAYLFPKDITVVAYEYIYHLCACSIDRLYRGVSPLEYQLHGNYQRFIVRDTYKSCSRKLVVAKHFQRDGHNHQIHIITTGPLLWPSISSSIGLNESIYYEEEVLFPPGINLQLMISEDNILARIIRTPNFFLLQHLMASVHKKLVALFQNEKQTFGHPKTLMLSNQDVIPSANTQNVFAELNRKYQVMLDKSQRRKYNPHYSRMYLKKYLSVFSRSTHKCKIKFVKLLSDRTHYSLDSLKAISFLFDAGFTNFEDIDEQHQLATELYSQITNYLWPILFKESVESKIFYHTSRLQTLIYTLFIVKQTTVNPKDILASIPSFDELEDELELDFNAYNAFYLLFITSLQAVYHYAPEQLNAKMINWLIEQFKESKLPSANFSLNELAQANIFIGNNLKVLKKIFNAVIADFSDNRLRVHRQNMSSLSFASNQSGLFSSLSNMPITSEQDTTTTQSFDTPSQLNPLNVLSMFSSFPSPPHGKDSEAHTSADEQQQNPLAVQTQTEQIQDLSQSSAEGFDFLDLLLN